MAGAQRSGARWIALLLGIALVASAAVAYALIKVTAPSADGEQAVSSTHVTVPSSIPVSPANDSVTSSDSPSVDRAPTISAVTEPSPATSTPATSAPDSPPPSSTTPVLPSPDMSTASSPVGSSSGAIPTVTSELSGSGVTLPAAWSGQATITVTVLGECATGSNSVYTDTPADLALDLPQNVASAVEPTVTSTLRSDEPTLTLGVNPTEPPSVTVYSSALDDTGTFHRYWALRLTPGKDRTRIHGTMIDQASDSDNPNLLADAETSLQPCEETGTVGLPRVLAPGSTISGWVSQTSAKLTLRATTTDGKRKLMVVVTASRNP